jgi:hypothetical protein
MPKRSSHMITNLPLLQETLGAHQTNNSLNWVPNLDKSGELKNTSHKKAFKIRCLIQILNSLNLGQLQTREMTKLQPFKTRY